VGTALIAVSTCMQRPLNVTKKMHGGNPTQTFNGALNKFV
jgi:hypothetical protein